MKIGLIDVDGRNFPNLAIMKLSAWHKRHGDQVEWWNGLEKYDRVYMSRVFGDEYSTDFPFVVNADEVVRGGTGYDLKNKLPNDVEHCFPDYSIYAHLIGANTAYGFLTRGCPRGCHFCIVAEKEGKCSKKVADLSEWWGGHKNIVLMDPNLLACTDRMDLLGQLIESGARVDVNQGFDCRLLTQDVVQSINRIKLKDIHFAWDYMKEEKAVLHGLELYKEYATRKVHGAFGSVYTLVNYDTSMEENLYRIYKLRDMGYDPYVMVFNKNKAPKEARRLQRWCNNRRIFKTCERFEDYEG